MLKKLFLGFVTITIGYWVWTGILLGVEAVIHILGILKIISLKELFNQGWYKPVLGLTLLAGFIASIVLSLRARKSKNIWYEIFKPTKEKLLVNLVLFVILVGIAFLLHKGRLVLIETSTFTLFDWRSNLPLTFAGVICALTFIYPFAAVLWSFKESFNKDNKQLKANKFYSIFNIETS